MKRPNDDKAPVGDTMSPLTIAILVIGLVFLAFILILPAGTLQTEAVYQGF